MASERPLLQKKGATCHFCGNINTADYDMVGKTYCPNCGESWNTKESETVPEPLKCPFCGSTNTRHYEELNKWDCLTCFAVWGTLAPPKPIIPIQDSFLTVQQFMDKHGPKVVQETLRTVLESKYLCVLPARPWRWYHEAWARIKLAWAILWGGGD